jgi:cytochrome c oxidase subunit I
VVSGRAELALRARCAKLHTLRFCFHGGVYPARAMAEGAPPRSSSDAPPQAKGWLGLALWTLFVGGGLSLVLIVSRVPGMTRFLDAPLVAKKSLVVHVNLVLTCWFFAFLVALFSMIPGRRSSTAPIALAVLGIVLFAVSGLIPGAEPILCNYVPVLDHPMFLVGMSIFTVSVALALADPTRLLGTVRPAGSAALLSDASVLGVRVATALCALGLVVLASSIVNTARGSDAHFFFESVFWGAGHVFQFVFLALMLSVWLLLVRDATGACPLPRASLARVVFGLVLLPALPSLWLIGKVPTDAGFYSLPTEMMRWGTWAAPIVVLFASARALWDAKRRAALRSSPSVNAFLVSVALLALGIGLGVFINRASTLVPAHYHATVGAVTVALMGMSYLFLDHLGRPLRDERMRRLARIQPLIFGVGQLGFVVGFAFAGVHGLGRKVYGSEQTLRGLEQTVGLGVMGMGGAFALLGGGLFFFLIVRSWYAR